MPRASEPKVVTAADPVGDLEPEHSGEFARSKARGVDDGAGVHIAAARRDSKPPRPRLDPLDPGMKDCRGPVGFRVDEEGACQGLGINDAAGGRPQCRGVMAQTRRPLSERVSVQEFAVHDPDLLRVSSELLEPFAIVFARRDDEFPGPTMGHVHALTPRVELLAAQDAAPRLQRARWVIQSGVNDPAVSTRDSSPFPTFALAQEDVAARPGDRAGDRAADDPSPDDGDLHAAMLGLWSRVDTRGGVGYGPRPMAFDYKPGIYKTTKFLSGHEAEIAPNMLVLIRTDGEFAPASVLKAVRNENNQWQFGMPGVKIPPASLNWGPSLRKVPHEGFYRLKAEYSFGDTGKWLKNAIVQLGYTSAADPILFIAQRRNPLAGNDLWFSDKGVKIEFDQIDTMLEALAWYQEPAKT
jgi:hypothetical protein